MAGDEQKIQELEKELSTTKYNKRTQKAVGLLKAKIARLRDKEAARGSKKGKSEGYAVRRTGDGTVILVGFPSTGKSTLLNALTEANSEVGSYAFTTLTVVPGVLEYRHARIQILDVPGVITGAASGKGRGREVLSCMRSADLCVLLIDALHPEQLDVLKKEVFDAGIRLDQQRPDVKIKKTAKDGIKIGKTVRLKRLDDETIESVLREFRINNADVVIREDIDDDQLIDCIEDNKKYMPSLVVLNKIDMVDDKTLEDVRRKVKPDIMISAKDNIHIDKLKQAIYDKLALISIWLKEPGEEADMEEPLIMFRGCTIRDVCEKLHKDFISKFKFARVWGDSAKFPGQRLMLHHRLKDDDVLELHTR